MKKKFGAFGARQFFVETLVGGGPGNTIFQNPGGGGGGWGGSHTRTGPGRPPMVMTQQTIKCLQDNNSTNRSSYQNSTTYRSSHSAYCFALRVLREAC